MANQYSDEGSSTSNIPGESSDTAVELNIKTLDSQIYSFRVDKNMPVSAFKAILANEIGVPEGQQRLIFRGKVLKDEHPLSEYQVENGHTLHLVTRQPAQQLPSSDTSSGDVNANNANQGNDASAGMPQNRFGQIAHSVVLGTFNVGDPTEGVVPDLSRVIGAVLNSFGLGGQAATSGIGGMQSSTMPNVSGQTQGNETSGASPSNVGDQGQAGNQAPHVQASPGQPFQSALQAMQIPTVALPIPSIHSPIPDSLSTLSEFMARLEQSLAQHGSQLNTSSGMDGVPRVELPSNVLGLQALIIVLRQAERLLGGHTIAALAHIAGCLEQEGASIDPSLRGQLQTESVQVGIAMQHLGALFLELGRTILTLRMGHPPAEASVNPGPAVYISPSGPNPIMVQPFPLQTHSLFGSTALQSNPPTVGIGNAPRNINIHIHAGTRSSNGAGVQGEQGNAAGSGRSGPVRVLPLRNIIATAPSRSTSVAVSNAAQPGISVSISQPPADSSLSSVISEVNSRLRNLAGNMQGEYPPVSGSDSSVADDNANNEQSNIMAGNGAGESIVASCGLPSEGDDQKKQDELLSSKDAPSSSVECPSGETSLKSEENSENATSSSGKHDLPKDVQSVPLGLGMGGLDHKRRIRQPKPLVKSDDDGTRTTPCSNQNANAGVSEQQLLQSLASQSSGTNDASTGQIPPVSRNPAGGPVGQQSSTAQLNASDIMSQVIHSPELNGLLAGVSQQTGVGSPNVLRGMLEQLTQNPQIMSTVSQIAQQVESPNLGNMFSGLGSGQGGSGLDLSRMMQQMMPVVTQVIGHRPAAQSFSPAQPESQQHCNERSLGGNEKPDDQNIQIDLQDVAQRIEHCNAPEDIFQAVTENAVRLTGRETRFRDIVHELSNNQDLINDYMEVLQDDINQQIESENGQDK